MRPVTRTKAKVIADARARVPSGIDYSPCAGRSAHLAWAGPIRGARGSRRVIQKDAGRIRGLRRLLVAFATSGAASLVVVSAASADPVEHVSNSLDTGTGSLRQAMTDVDPGGEIVFDSATDDPGLADQIMIDKDVTITGLGAGTTTITGDSNRSPTTSP